MSHKRKTLSAQDIVEAIEQIGFEEFSQKLLDFQNEIKREKSRKQMSKKSTEKDYNLSNASRSSDISVEEDEEVVEMEEIYISDGE